MKNFKLFIGVAAMAALLTTSCNKVIEVESVELDPITITLEIGQKQTLTATVLPADATDKSVTWTSSDASVASVENGVVTANWQGTATITATAGIFTATCVVTVKGVVEINGVRWAISNVGEVGIFVSNPEDYGNHYNFADARNACPTGWRVPTYNELGSLFSLTKVSRVKEVLNDINGMRFTDITTGNNLFLPAAGYRDGSSGMINDVGLSGNYWSSEAVDNDLAYSYYFFFDTGAVGLNSDTPRQNGQSVRCVEE